MRSSPFVSTFLRESASLATADAHIQRRLSEMVGFFSDDAAYERRLREENPVLYEVYEIKRPEVAGEILHGLSVVHPGLIGNEFFMTKGHFHEALETAEIYYCLAGRGLMVMENPEGEWAAEPLRPDMVLYVPPRWAHRSVNTSLEDDLITFFAYPGNAGHDYGTIERQGFRKLVVNQEDKPAIVDNPDWLPPGSRP